MEKPKIKCSRCGTIWKIDPDLYDVAFKDWTDEQKKAWVCYACEERERIVKEGEELQLEMATRV